MNLHVSLQKYCLHMGQCSSVSVVIQYGVYTPHYLSKNRKNSEFCNTAAPAVLDKGLWTCSTIIFFFSMLRKYQILFLIGDGTQPDGRACQASSSLSLTKSKAT